MQYILTKNNNRLPFYNIRKVTDNNNQPISIVISFRESELLTANYTITSLIDLMKDATTIGELSTYSESNILLNTYHSYSKLDETSCRYKYLISPYIPAVEPQEEQVDEDGNVVIPAIEGTEAVPEVRDTLLTVTLLKQSDLEVKIDDTSKTVDAIAVAIAEIMGV